MRSGERGAGSGKSKGNRKIGEWGIGYRGMGRQVSGVSGTSGISGISGISGVELAALVFSVFLPWVGSRLRP